MASTLTQLQLGFEFQLNNLTLSQDNSDNDVDYTPLYDVMQDARARLAQKVKRLPCWSQKSEHPDDDFEIYPYELLEDFGEVEDFGGKGVLGMYFATGREAPLAEIKALRLATMEAVHEAASAAGIPYEYARTRLYREVVVTSWETLTE